MTELEKSQPKRKRGRPAKFEGAKRGHFSSRMTEETQRRLIEAAKASGRSLSEEIEFRLNRDLSWEAMKRDIETLYAEAAAARDTARILSIKEAGLQIIREMDGKPGRVVVTIEMLLGLADGLQRSGFVSPEQAAQPPPKQSRPKTAEEAEAALQEIEQMIATARAKLDDDKAA